MPLAPLFGIFREGIDKSFAKAKNDAGSLVAHISLDIKENPINSRGPRAQFAVITPNGPVRITWNGVVSLWAFAQGAIRIVHRMYDGRRAGLMKLELDEFPELEVALNSLELSRRFIYNDIPQQAANLNMWPSWAPPIEPHASEGTDDKTGFDFFLGILNWIFLHELAHIHLDHDTRQTAEGLSELECELEADQQATIWVRGDFRADVGLIPGSATSKTDLGLELRAMYVGLGLIWVSLFEDNIRPQEHATHPPPTERIMACFDLMGLPVDSAAAEIISDIIIAWIDPEGKIERGEIFNTPHEALSESLVILHRRLSNK